ncbi:MAG: hypothetical protein HC822_12555 [Oscillochloris sp.]|nr:hypothetical protein [Oscillochloris sp.]
MLFFGIFLLVLAVIFFFIARSAKDKAGKLSATDTYDAATLQKLHARITGTLGADALAEQCEIAGTVEVDQPLRGKLSGKSVVAYNATVTREYEERVTKRNAEGNMETTTERGSEQIEAYGEQIAFYVRDQSGRVRVEADGAEIDMVETHNTLTQPTGKNAGNRRTTGIRSIERALPVGVQVFIHGCAVDRGGEVVIAKNTRKSGEKFIISRSSEQELLQSANSTVRNMQIASAVCSALGVVFMLWGMIS